MAQRGPLPADPTVGGLHVLGAGRISGTDLYLLRTPTNATVVKVYRGWTCRQRRAHERAMLTLWHRHGFFVPKVCSLTLPRARYPYLAIVFVPGPSLSEVLRDDERPEAEKLAALHRVYRALRDRHRFAIEARDIRLIHPDCNTGNVILSGQRVVWIDLDRQNRRTSVVDGAAAEICKLTHCAVRDLSIDSVSRVCSVLRSAYAGMEALLERVWQRKCDRAFQFVHRWRNHLRKRASPRLVTVYDIADGLQRSLNRAGSNRADYDAEPVFAPGGPFRVLCQPPDAGAPLELEPRASSNRGGPLDDNAISRLRAA